MKRTLRIIGIIAGALLLTALFSCVRPTPTPPEPPEPPVHEHDFGAWTVARESSCSAQGLRERSCACGEKQSEELAMTAHTAGQWQTETTPTCTTKGQQYRECTVCHTRVEEQSLPALGHDEISHAAQAPTCTTIG